MRFYNIKDGKIFIKNKHINEYSLEELREEIAYVPQDTYLFDGTIEENIRYGKMSATKEDIVAAAKAAYADDFITVLENGYETNVGERGLGLSGGQRQRIAIARALLKDADILLLDEATSSLDSQSESLVQKALNILMKGRTTLVVAHRLSTIENANNIYVLSNGSIVESGKHQELLLLDGLYKELYDSNYKDNQRL